MTSANTMPRGDVLRVLGKENSPGRGRMIHGVASTPRLDAHGTRIWPAGMIAAVPTPLLFAHSASSQIGEVGFIRVHDDAIYIQARLDYTPAGKDAYREIEAGRLPALSIRLETEFVSQSPCCAPNITRWRLKEISAVKAPANLDCWLALFTPPVKMIPAVAAYRVAPRRDAKGS